MAEQDDRIAELEAKVLRLEAHIARIEAELEEHLITCPGSAKVARDRAMRGQADRSVAEGA